MTDSCASALQVRTKGDSCGGVVTCVCRNVPRGLGAPVFDKLEADLAHAMLSLPATKGFEVGSGFEGTRMKGTEHNDAFYMDAASGLLRTASNRSGGIQGGISNGEAIVLRVAFKPTSTVTQAQRTVTRAGEETELRARGRHTLRYRGKVAAKGKGELDTFWLEAAEAAGAAEGAPADAMC